jgi:hypothetical protein
MRIVKFKAGIDIAYLFYILILLDFWVFSIIWYSQKNIVSETSEKVETIRGLTAITSPVCRHSPHLHLRTETDPVSEMLCSFQNTRQCPEVL